MKKKAAVRIPAKIAADIGASIVSGRLKPGAVLDGEIEASSTLKISRTCYREAIRILTAKGLVVSRPKVGTRVSTWESWHMLDPDVIGWIFARQPSHTLLVNLFELRRMVEPEAAARAAERRTQAQLNQMGAELEVMARESLLSDLGRLADRNFHAQLLAAAGNPFLVSLAGSVTAVIGLSTEFKHLAQRRKHNSIPDHVKVFEAVAARDPVAARAAMNELIDLAFEDFLAVQRRRKGGP